MRGREASLRGPRMVFWIVWASFKQPFCMYCIYFVYDSVRLMLRPTGQSDKIQSIKSSQYIGSIGSIGSIGYIGSIVHTGNIPPVK